MSREASQTKAIYPAVQLGTLINCGDIGYRCLRATWVNGEGTVKLLQSLIIALALAAVPGSEPYSEKSEDRLEGIKNVVVIAGVVGDDSLGIDNAKVKNKVELELRRSNIHVVENFKDLPDPWSNSMLIFVVIQLITPKDPDIPLLVFDVEFKAQEYVTGAASGKRYLAAAWQDGRPGFTTREDTDTVMEVLNDAIESFCNDYMACNPPKN